MKNKIIAIVIFAFLVRVSLGSFAFGYLPTLSSGSEPQKAGYLFYDAYHRDTQAWDLAQSSEPLTVAFSEKRTSDQYGGLLWLLAAVYRYIPLGSHNPILPVLISALAASIGVGIFAYTVSQFVSENWAISLTGVMAIYPESFLLGASQMREPYLIMLVTLGLFGMIAVSQAKGVVGVWSIALSLIGILLISPGVALPMIILIGGWYALGAWKQELPIKKILIAAGLFLGAIFIAVVILGASWETVTTYKGGGVLGIVGEWAKRTAQYNSYLLKQSSGIVQVMMATLPQWLAFPFVAIYGLLQPVLPAVLFEPGEMFWKVIGFLRSVGWYSLLPILMIFPFGLRTSPIGTRKTQWVWVYAVLVTWVLVSSLRGGGDQWDNPRYRTILLPTMLLLVAVYLNQLNALGKTWLRRIFAIEGFNLILFCHWYSWRYTGFGVDLGIRNTILIGICGSVALLFAIRQPKSTAL